MNRDIDYSLYLVTDNQLAGQRDLTDIIEEGITGGVTIVQLREKSLDTGPFLKKAIDIHTITRKKNVPFIINDRIDIALACHADGVHLGQSDMPIEYARQILGDDYLIGISISSVDEALEAQEKRADYIAISPVWSTPTKTDTPRAVGLEGIVEISEKIDIPIVGIGGINRENCKSVIEAGCHGIAVVSAIICSENPESAASELSSKIQVKDK